MIIKSDSLNRTSTNDKTYNYNNKDITVKNSIAFSTEERKALEESIVDTLYEIFTKGKVGLHN